MAGRNYSNLMSKWHLTNSYSVRGSTKTAEGKHITIVIAACHVILAVPVVLVGHFVLSRTKEMNDVMPQTVQRHALDQRGDISGVRYSIHGLK